MLEWLKYYILWGLIFFGASVAVFSIGLLIWYIIHKIKRCK